MSAHSVAQGPSERTNSSPCQTLAGLPRVVGKDDGLNAVVLLGLDVPRSLAAL